MKLPPLPSPHEQDLLARAAQWGTHQYLSDLTEEALAELATAENLDFATALCYDRLTQSSEHGAFIRRINELMETAELFAPPDAPRIVIVPGAFHREHRHTGANGERLIAELGEYGYRVELIPTLSFGRLRESAQIINDWLARDARGPIVLISLSKGSADVKIALREPSAAHAFRPVVAWINLSGMLEGTALVDWLHRQRLRYLAVRLLFWWRRYAVEGMGDLRRGPGTLLADDITLPAGMTQIHVIGFPLRAHLSSSLAVRGHRRLTPLGPNDGGGILLADVLARAGLVYPVWGADHYLRPPWDARRLFAALLRYLAEQRNPNEGVKPSRAAPNLVA